MNQRSANNDDVLTRPWCNSREYLLVKWKEDGTIVSDWASVGCERFKKFASGDQTINTKNLSSICVQKIRL
jgi:hypothetical protein